MESIMIEKVIGLLLKIKENPNKNTGICGNFLLNFFVYDNCLEIDEKTFKIYEEVGSKIYEIFKTWPEFSGDNSYPVPSGSTLSPRDVFIRTHDLWKGAYGNARKRLLDFVIQQLEKELLNDRK